ncbi:MAG TPA: Ig-like domain repeat protein [Candidatus Binatia bacterium]|nr:Ig-like domain repeat protein [Candidatus Binatia bacterium]
MPRPLSKAGLVVASAALLLSTVAAGLAVGWGSLGLAAGLPQGGGLHPLCGPVPAGRMRCETYLSSGALGTPSPVGYAPADLDSAYSLPGPQSGAGAARTVAVVDAYDDPSAESDLAVYRSQFGLPACTTANGCFRKVDQNGGTSYPTYNQNWAGEISVDLDMVSAACPNCRILLVEATSEVTTDLGTAEDTAVRLGATEVSNSFGGPEVPDEVQADGYFDHPGIPTTFGAGDIGYGVAWPASSPYVISVGGTSLVRDPSNPRGWSETVWNDGEGATGSGCSAYEPMPSWQGSVPTITAACSHRADNDISVVGDPDTGVSVYDSNAGASGGNWLTAGGTSVGAPIVAAMYALGGTPASSPASSLYQAAGPADQSSSFNDVTSGSDGSCGTILCNAGPGWDGPTGLGTPNGLAAFGGAAAPSASTTTLTASPTMSFPGEAVTLTAQVAGAAGHSGPVSGSVTFVTGATSLGAVAVDGSGAATLITTSLPAGDDAVTADYGGSAGLAASQSAAVQVQVSASAAPAGSAYTALEPFRLCDTRRGTGTECSGSASDNLIGPGAGLTFQVTEVAGPEAQTVPAGADAVVFNLTAVQGSAATYLTAYPTGQGVPTASNLNVPRGAIQANLVVAALGSGGQVTVYNSQGSINMIADVQGYFMASSGGAATPGLFHPLPPLRLCDTRPGTSTACSGHPLVAGQWTKIVLSGCPGGTACPGSLPADGTAAAVALNLTAVFGTTGTYLSVAPTTSGGTCPGGAPSFSNLNVGGGGVLANRVIVPLGPDQLGGPDQDVCVYSAQGTINFITDVNGWFGSGRESTAGARYFAVSPVRICDTRAATQVGYSTECSGTPLSTATSLQVQVAGVDGVPAPGGGAPVALVANVTAVSGSAATYFTLYPADAALPTASDLNPGPGQVVPNLGIVQLATSSSPGSFDLYNAQGAINAIADVEGWFA